MSRRIDVEAVHDLVHAEEQLATGESKRGEVIAGSKDHAVRRRIGSLIEHDGKHV